MRSKSIEMRFMVGVAPFRCLLRIRDPGLGTSRVSQDDPSGAMVQGAKPWPGLSNLLPSTFFRSVRRRANSRCGPFQHVSQLFAAWFHERDADVLFSRQLNFQLQARLQVARHLELAERVGG